MLKKIFIVLGLTAIMLGIVLAPAVLAQTEIPDSCVIRVDLGDKVPEDWHCPAKGQPCSFTEADMACGLCCVMSTVFYASDIVFIVLIAFVIIFVLMGAFDILQSAGESEKLNKGRDRIAYAAVGFGAALLAKAVPALVRFLIS